MIVHPKFIFLHLPKTGGTFIENYLSGSPQGVNGNIKNACHVGKVLEKYLNEDIENRKHTCRHDPVYRITEKTKDRTKFGYIRNPYDWYLSFWSYSKDGSDATYLNLHTEESKKDINVFIEHLSNTRIALCYYTNKIVEGETKPLSHIDLGIAADLDIGLYTYKYLHTYFHPDVFNDIENYKKYFLVDKILRFENLREDLEIFFKENIFELNESQTTLLYRAPKVRATKHRHYSEDYYNIETIELIKHKDRIIFDTYDYEFYTGYMYKE